MRFSLLGPLVVVDEADREVRLSGIRQRILLASLVLHAETPVSLDALADSVWDGFPPSRAATTLRSHVRRLRSSLGTRSGVPIAAQSPGYVIHLRDSELDVAQFEALCRQAGAARRVGAWPEVSAAATRALDLWRGAPLLDIPSRVLREEFVPHLEQLRLQVLDDRIEAELRLGTHDRLVPQLRDLTTQFPFYERFHAQLMTALARAGRRAEALDAFHRARQVLAGELGVEPGPELQRLEREILAGDLLVTPPAQAAAPPGGGDDGVRAVVPRLLPAAVPHFTGRRAALKTLSGLLDLAERPGGTVVISAISGMAGVGKTALAVHWAHQHADRFPDGQLYVNLRGFDPSGTPMPTTTAIRRFLDALAVPPERVPADPDAQGDLYRSLLADKRMLIVLDNARDPDQTRPLLPGTAGCLVLITSRNQFTDLIALDGAIPVTVDVLSTDEARQLLTRRLGAEQITRDEPAAHELIDQCGRLPLALNIVAARAAMHPDDPLDTVTAELRDRRRRLDRLSAGPADVSAVFSWSYRILARSTARVFRLLGLHPGPDISIAAAASLAAMDHEDAHSALVELTVAHLLTEHLPGRYGLHDLVRAYAAQRASIDETDQERRQATCRMLDHYLHTALAADRVLEPKRDPIALAPPQPGVVPESLASPGQIWQWFHHEHPVVTAVIAYAARAGYDAYAWRIPWALADCLQRQGHWHDQIATHRVALAAAQRLNDLAAQAYAHRVLGRAHTRLGTYQDAYVHLYRALELHEQVGDPLGMAAAHRGLAWVYDRDSRTDDALDHALEHARQAANLFRAARDAAGEASALNAVGWLHSRRGDHHRALSACRVALDLLRESRDPTGEAHTLVSLGRAHHHLGHHADAVDCYRRALPILRDYGERYFEADTLIQLGDTYHAANDLEAAHRSWWQALIILTDLHHPDARRVRAKLDTSDQNPATITAPPGPAPASPGG